MGITASPRLVRLLALTAAIGWLIAGLWGAWLYVSRYEKYRGFAPPVADVGVRPGVTESITFHSTALRGVHRYLVHLPPGYLQAARHGKRFGVVYLLHGNPGQPEQFVNVAALAARADTLTSRGRIPPMIYAMPAGPPGYSNNDTEWANARLGRYEAFVKEVVHRVDRRFATIPDRGHRIIAGLSEGGFGAVNIGLRNLALFSGIQSWSGTFTETATGPFRGMPMAVVHANSPTAYVPAMAPAIRRSGLRVYLYQGRSDRGGPAMQAFAAELRRAGASVQDRLYRGGHDWALWRSQIPHMLRVDGTWMSTPPTVSPAGPAGLRRPSATRPRAATRTARRARPGRARRCAGCGPP
jgi:enterochelin esterase-like enzyme